MMCSKPSSKTLLVLAVAALVVLNLATFVIAYPETYTLTPGINAEGSILAKDFSAYYVAAWRLWHNPQNVYSLGALGGGEPVTPPRPEAYKYLPSFLFLFSPFLVLDYQSALLAFDILQFALLPLLAFMVVRLMEGKGLALTLLILIIVLLLPFPTIKWGFSVSYYWQWGEGQAKVLETFLLLVGLYFGRRGRPWLSGCFLALGFFDPRFGLLAIPLFVMYNWRSLKKAIPSFVVVLCASNAILLYPGLGGSFLMMVSNSSLSTPLYYYSLIPFFTLVALIFINLKEMIVTFDYYEVFKQYTKNWKIQN